jgi:hypothetical protein
MRRTCQLPLWWVAFLLHLGEYAFGLIVLAVRARRHLAIALDLFFPTHVASLWFRISIHCYAF